MLSTHCLLLCSLALWYESPQPLLLKSHVSCIRRHAFPSTPTDLRHHLNQNWNRNRNRNSRVGRPQNVACAPHATRTPPPQQLKRIHIPRCAVRRVHHGGHGGHAVKGVYHGCHAMVKPRSATERFVDSLNEYKERGITDRVRREAKVSDGWSSSYPMSMLVFVFGFRFLHYIVITTVVRSSITPFGGGYLSM